MNKMMLAGASVLVLLSACKTMETADKKMQSVDRKVSEADAKFRKNIGLRPYTKDSQPVASESN